MQLVRYGDVLCFEDSEAQGFVSGDPGLTDAVYIDAFPKFDPGTVGRNQRHCCFVIEHADDYNARKAFQRKLRSLPRHLNEFNWAAQLDPTDPLYIELEELHERVQDEKVTNGVEAERMIATSVKYGSLVHIRHVSSAMLLSQSKNRAALNPVALQVCLSEEGSDGSKWKLLPTVRTKEEGEEVHFGDQILLASAKHRSSFLSIFASIDSAVLTSTVCHNNDVDRFEVNSSEEPTKLRLSLFQNCDTSLKPHQAGPALPGKREQLKAMDVITVCHKQHDLFLVADEERGVHWEPRDRVWFDAENPFPSAMWTVMHHALDQGDGALALPSAGMTLHHLPTHLCLRVKGPPGKQTLVLGRPGRADAKWSFDGPEVTEDGEQQPMRDGDFVWMRHDQGHGHQPVWLSAPVPGDAHGEMSPLHSARNHTHRIHDEQDHHHNNHHHHPADLKPVPAKLREAAGGELLDMLELSLVQRSGWVSADLVSRAGRALQQTCKALSEAARQDQSCPPASTIGPAVEDWYVHSAFRRVLESEGEAVRTSVRSLAGVCGAPTGFEVVRKREGDGSGAEEEFLDGESMEETADHHVLVCRRQLLRQFGVLNTCVHLIRVCTEETGVQPVVIPRLLGVQWLLRVIFGLVKVACHGLENRDNKRAMASALPLFQSCLVANCGAYGAILSVYSGTRSILEGLDDDVFTDTMASFLKTRLPSVLSLAIETCRCEGRPIKKNQDRWVRAIFPAPPNVDPRRTFKQQDAPSPVCMEVAVRDKEVLLYSWLFTRKGQRIVLLLRSNALVKEDLSALDAEDAMGLTPAAVLEYHLAVMRLLQALLTGGNWQTRAALMVRSKRLGLQCGQLLSMLGNDSLPYLFRARCADLLQHLYVEASHRRRLPSTMSVIWVWSKLETRELAREPSTAQSEVLSKQELQELERVVVGKLRRESVHGCERSEHELHQSLVALLAALLEAGFYHREHRWHLVVNTEEVAALAGPLIGLLDEGGSKREDSGLQAGTRRVKVNVKVAVLTLLGRLVECCWVTRSAELFTAWEDVLADSLQCGGWAALLSASKAAAEHRGEGHKQNLGEKALKFFGVERHNLEDYGAMPQLWTSKPPWSQSTIEHVDRALFASHPLMPEISYAKLESLGQRGAGNVNRVIRVVLALVLDEDLTLKERAMHFLFQAFKQRKKVVTMLGEATFICQPAMLAHYASIRSDFQKLQSLSRLIRDASHPWLDRQPVQDSLRPRLDSIDVRDRESNNQISRASSSEEEDTEWLDAVDQVAEILERWVTAGAASPAGWETSADEVQRLLSQLEVEPVLASLLNTPLLRHAVPMQYDLPVGEGVRVAGMMSPCLRVVAGLCGFSSKQRSFWAGQADSLWRLVGVQGVEAEDALSALARGNVELLNAEGGRWARRYFRETVDRCQCCYARGLTFVGSLLSPHGERSAEIIMAVLSRFKGLEASQEVLMRGRAWWDQRLQLMVADELSSGGESGQLALHLASLNVLALACVGKNTAAEVYCSHLLPFEEVVTTFRKIHQDCQGVMYRIPKATEVRMKQAYLRVLYHLYFETSAVQLVAESFRPGNGIWDARPGEYPPCKSVAETLLADVRDFRASAIRFNGQEKLGRGAESKAMRAMMQYMVEAVLPFTSTLFGHRSMASVLSPRQVKLAESLAQELSELRAQGLPLACSAVIMAGRTVHVKDATRSALIEILSRLGRTKELRQLGEENEETLKGRVVAPNLMLRAGLQAMVNSVGLYARINHNRHGVRSVSTVGSRQLARLLATDDMLDLRGSEGAEGGDGQQPKPRRRRKQELQYSYSQVAMNMLAPLRTDAATRVVPELLVDLLSTLRATLYLAEPADPHLSNKSSRKPSDMSKGGSIQDEVGQRYQAFLQDEAIEKKHGPKEEMLQWVQDKYDALGCTEAAMRLLGHERPEVHFNALRLLVSLLQGGNRRVQNTIRLVLPTKWGKRGLQHVKYTIEEGVQRVTVFKRNIKVQRQAENYGATAGQLDDLVPDQGLSQEEFGRQSALMFALRLVQLMCEGQYTPLQDRMADRDDGSSVLEECVELFLALQSAMGEALARSNGELAVLCVQVVETVSECVQGPNRVNQQVLLGGNFFSGVNRLLSALTFSPQPAPPPLESAEKSMTLNDLKCWLKHALLGCCIAMFEAVRDESELQNLFKLVHSRNIIASLIAAAGVLSLPLNAKPAGNDDAGDDEPQSRARHIWDETLHDPLRALSSFNFTSAKQRKRRTHRSWRRLKKAGKEAGWDATFSAGSDKELLEYVLRLYIVLLIFKEYCLDPGPRLRIQQFEAEQPELTAFLSSHTSHIECVRQIDGSGDPLAEKVFFNLRPEVARVIRSRDFVLRASPVIFDVPRENPWEKGREFMKRVKALYYNVDWYEVIRKWKLFRVCTNNRARIDAAPFWVAAVITLLLLVVYGLPWDPHSDTVFGEGKFFGFESRPPTYREEPYPHAEQTSDPDGSGATYGSVMSQLDPALKFRLSLKSRWESDAEWIAFEPWARPVIFGFCIFHAVLTGFSGILHLILDFPLTFLSCLEELRVRSNVEGGSGRGRQGGLTGQDFLDNLPPIPVAAGNYGTWAVFRAVLRRSKRSLYYALLLIIAILGVLSSPFFAVLYLLDAFSGSNGKLVVRSMVVGGPNLLRTFLLAIVVLVCFGFMSYAYFSVVINEVQELCHSPFQCVAIHILDSFTGDLTTVLGDDLGDFAFPATVVWASGWDTFRTLVVIISIIVWVFLLQGIIQGQIIDAFAEMRDKLQEANADLERKCFISSVDRYVFQSYPGEWEKRKNGKFAWNYLLYYSHLRHKDPEEYNGMDHFAAKAFDEERADLLPIGVFVAKQRTEQRDKGSKVERQISVLQGQVVRMQRMLDAVAASAITKDDFDRRLSPLLGRRSETGTPEFGPGSTSAARVPDGLSLSAASGIISLPPWTRGTVSMAPPLATFADADELGVERMEGVERHAAVRALFWHDSRPMQDPAVPVVPLPEENDPYRQAPLEEDPTEQREEEVREEVGEC